MGKVAGIRIALIVLAASVIVAGCGGNGATLVETGDTSPAVDQRVDDTPSDGWLSFPPLIDGNFSEYRLTSESERTVEGSDFATAHGADNYEIPATEDYVIVSGSDDPLAWAIYHLAELDTERPVSLHFTIGEAGESVGADPLPLGCWVGITDYTTAHWRWYGPFVQPATLVVNCANNRDRYVSAAHVMSFAMLTCSSSRYASPENPAGRTAALIDCSVITTLAADDEDYLVTLPHYAAIDDVTLGDGGESGAKGASALDPGQYVNLYWEHVVDAANEDNEADQYEVYRRAQGDAQHQLIGAVDAPAETYTDPTDNDAGVDEPLPDTTYMYYLRAGNTVGYTSFDAVPVTIPDDGPPPNAIYITAYTVRIENASNGIGFDPELFNEENDEGSIGANAATELSLEWIEGTFNALPFTGEDDSGWPEPMSQDDYDIAFSAARDNLQWSIYHNGAVDCRRTDDWLKLAGGGFPCTGEPGMGTVFPDDDPETMDPASEGGLNLYLPSEVEATYPDTAELKVHVMAPITFAVDMDVELDPFAPVLQEYQDSEGEPLEYLPLLGNTLVKIPFDWGVNGEPADLSLTSLELKKLEGTGNCTITAVDFTYNSSAADPGEFTYLNAGGDDYVVCNIPSSQLTYGSYYSCRLSDGACWSSINKPGEMLLATIQNQPPELVTVPEHCWPDIDYLQVFYPDPVVRRNPNYTAHWTAGRCRWTGAFNDVLKINGDEFFLHISDLIYPQVAVKETNDPDTITSLE